MSVNRGALIILLTLMVQLFIAMMQLAYHGWERALVTSVGPACLGWGVGLVLRWAVERRRRRLSGSEL